MKFELNNEYRVNLTNNQIHHCQMHFYERQLLLKNCSNFLKSKLLRNYRKF